VGAAGRPTAVDPLLRFGLRFPRSPAPIDPGIENLISDAMGEVEEGVVSSKGPGTSGAASGEGKGPDDTPCLPPGPDITLYVGDKVRPPYVGWHWER
jgi:hypothetical protein